MNADEIKLLESVFIDGYRKASDKLGFLHLSGIPMELDLEGRPQAKLVEVKIVETFTVGQAGPGFGSRELVYHPLPGEMVTSENLLEFHFVHTEGHETFSLTQLLAIRDGRNPDDAKHDHDHAHDHHHHH